jgi:hypothetical protein
LSSFGLAEARMIIDSLGGQTKAECNSFINAVTAGTLRAPYYHAWDNSPFENPAETPPTPTWP